MTSFLFLSLMMALASTLILATSPLFLGLWIIILALMMAMTASMTLTSWIGLMMFLIYVGGLLVMFAYFVALTPNLLIEGKTMMLTLTLSAPLLFSLMLLIPISDNKILSDVSQLPMGFLMAQNLESITLIALTLFFALVATVKICGTFSAPLRPFN
uniref:NADH dehydrogenase subunit 6 n=1 Tax=Prionospio sp. 4 MH-2023 TaxID=3059272 RepID=A0AAU6QGT6_9ANNE